MARNRDTIARAYFAMLLSLLLIEAFSCNGCTRGSAIKVGAILALTGPAKSLGTPEEIALRDFVNQVNSPDVGGIRGRKLEVDIRDSAGNPDRAGTLFRSFAADPAVIAVIGPTTTGESVNVAPIAEDQHVPLLSLAASSSIVVNPDGSTRQWVFKFAQNDNLAAERILRVMEAEGHHRAALLWSDDAFGKSGAGVFRTLSGSYGVELVFVQGFSPQETSFAPMVAALPANLQAAIVWGTSPGPALIVRELRKARGGMRTYLSHGNASPEFIADAKGAADGVVLVGSKVLVAGQLSKDDRQFEVIQRFQKHWTGSHPLQTPSHFGGHAQDAIDFLAQVLSAGASDRISVRNGLETIGERPGVTGVFHFTPVDHAGLTADSFALLTVNHSHFVIYEPSAR